MEGDFEFKDYEDESARRLTAGPTGTDVLVTEDFEFRESGHDGGPKTLGEFFVLEEVGDGSFSTVKRMRNPVSKKEFGLKVYNKLFLVGQKKIDFETGEWTNLLARIEREVRIWISLSHPHVCKLFEIYDKADCQYLYLRIELGDLGQVSEFDTKERVIYMNPKLMQAYKLKKNLAARDAVVRDVFRQMVEGLAYLHSVGVAHRDVKLENLVATSELKVMWIDFNSSKQFLPGERFKDYEGTLHYAAPECIFGLDDGYDPCKADVWALGVCLFTLVYSRLPFDLPPDEDGNDYAYEMELNIKIRDQPAVYPEGAAPDLEALVRGMLEKDPSKRLSLDQVKSHKYCASA